MKRLQTSSTLVLIAVMGFNARVAICCRDEDGITGILYFDFADPILHRLNPMFENSYFRYSFSKVFY